MAFVAHQLKTISENWRSSGGYFHQGHIFWSKLFRVNCWAKSKRFHRPKWRASREIRKRLRAIRANGVSLRLSVLKKRGRGKKLRSSLSLFQIKLILVKQRFVFCFVFFPSFVNLLLYLMLILLISHLCITFLFYCNSFLFF